MQEKKERVNNSRLSPINLLKDKIPQIMNFFPSHDSRSVNLLNGKKRRTITTQLMFIVAHSKWNAYPFGTWTAV